MPLPMASFLQQIVALLAPGTESTIANDGESATLEFDGHMTVDVTDEGEDVFGLYCVVWEFQDEPPPWLLQDIAEANYGCAGTNGATLGMHPAVRSVLLTRLWCHQKDVPQRSREIFDLFIETAAHFKQRFDALLLQSSAAPAPDPESASAAEPAKAFRDSRFLKV